MSSLDDIQDNFIQLWGNLASFWGITPAAGRVLGWLICHADGADGETIGDSLGMSRGAVSMALRELSDWGLVRTQKLPGTRRLIYHPETEIDKVIRNIIQTRKRREWDPILENVDSWLPQLRSQRSKEAVVFRERLEEIQTVISAVDDMAASFLRGGVVQNLGLDLLLAKTRRRLKKSKKSPGGGKK